MTMLEKIAKAIDREWCEWQRNRNGSPTIYSNILNEKMARSALEAMREPSDAMNLAGADRLTNEFRMGEGQPREFITEYEMKQGWRAMIDAALNEKSE